MFKNYLLKRTSFSFLSYLNLPLYSIQLDRNKHLAYLKKGLTGLGPWGKALDASKPWLVYWIFHSLDLLEFNFDQVLIQR